MFKRRRERIADKIIILINKRLNLLFENFTNKLNSNFEILEENEKLKNKINSLEQKIQDQKIEFDLKIKDKNNLIEKQNLELVLVKKQMIETDKKYTRFVNSTSELVKLIIPPNEEVAKKMRNFISKCTKITHLPPTGPRSGQPVGIGGTTNSAKRSQIIKGVKE